MRAGHDGEEVDPYIAGPRPGKFARSHLALWMRCAWSVASMVERVRCAGLGVPGLARGLAVVGERSRPRAGLSLDGVDT